VPPAPSELVQLEEWQRMQVPHEWLPSPTFWVRLLTRGRKVAALSCDATSLHVELAPGATSHRVWLLLLLLLLLFSCHW